MCCDGIVFANIFLTLADKRDDAMTFGTWAQITKNRYEGARPSRRLHRAIMVSAKNTMEELPPKSFNMGLRRTVWITMPITEREGEKRKRGEYYDSYRFSLVDDRVFTKVAGLNKNVCGHR